MTDTIYIEPLTNSGFSSFGDVIETNSRPAEIINQGRCHRYSDLASLEFSSHGRAGISLFQGRACTLPYTLEYVERHPLGSQAFLPMSEDPFLVLVAEDEEGRPVRSRAFVTTPGQGVNYHPNVWHGVLTPLRDGALFAVVDRIGGGKNIEEYWFDEPFLVKYPLG